VQTDRRVLGRQGGLPQWAPPHAKARHGFPSLHRLPEQNQITFKLLSNPYFQTRSAFPQQVKKKQLPMTLENPYQTLKSKGSVGGLTCCWGQSVFARWRKV
jgi:hypothetical protein